MDRVVFDSLSHLSIAYRLRLVDKAYRAIIAKESLKFERD